MRRFFISLFVLLVVGAVYTTLGNYGYHDFWVPVHVEQEEGPSVKVTANIEYEDMEEKVDSLLNSGKVKQAKRVLNHKVDELSKLKEEQVKKYKPLLAYLLGKVHLKLDQKEQAKKNFEKYLNLSPDGDYTAKTHLYLAQTTEDRKEKLQHLRSAAHKDPRGEIGKKVAEQLSGLLGSDPAPDVRLLQLSLSLFHKTDPGSKKRQELVKTIQPVADKVFQEEKLYLDATKYTVESGDVLANIGKKYNINAGWINYTNNRPLPIIGDNASDLAERLQRKEVLVIFPGSLTLHVSTKDRRLYVLYRDLYFVKSYPVGIGKGGSERTPLGTFVVNKKNIKPSWTHPETGEQLPYGHPDNIIGTRWISINVSGYGIHGIDEKLSDTIGKRSSMGCIRMHNRHCEELFDLIPNPNLVPEEANTTVRITK